MKKYNGIDLIKFIMIIFVVINHTMYLDSDGVFFNTIINSAVPFYFCSIGFLLENKIQQKKITELQVLKNYLKKTIKLYLVWSIIFLPITLYGYIVISKNKVVFPDMIIFLLKKYIFKGEQFYSWPLWFLLCSIYSILLILIFRKMRFNYKTIYIISLILFIIGNIYSNMIININSYSGFMSTILNGINNLCGPTGRMLFGMLYICFGIFACKNKERFYTAKKINYITIILLLFASIFTKFVLIKVLLYFSIFIFAFTLDLSDCKLFLYLRKSEVIIYFTHMIVFFFYSLFFGFNSCKGVTAFLFTIIVTLLFSIFVVLINKKKKIKILNIIYNY